MRVVLLICYLKWGNCFSVYRSTWGPLITRKLSPAGSRIASGENNSGEENSCDLQNRSKNESMYFIVNWKARWCRTRNWGQNSAEFQLTDTGYKTTLGLRWKLESDDNFSHCVVVRFNWNKLCVSTHLITSVLLGEGGEKKLHLWSGLFSTQKVPFRSSIKRKVLPQVLREEDSKPFHHRVLCRGVDEWEKPHLNTSHTT